MKSYKDVYEVVFGDNKLALESIENITGTKFINNKTIIEPQINNPDIKKEKEVKEEITTF